MELSYGKRLHQAARQEFQKFWSDYRCWLLFIASCQSPVLLQIMRHGIRSMVNLQETLVNALGGFFMSLIGTYLIAMRKGGETLDSHKAGIISGLTEQNSKLYELAYPKVPVEEQERRQQVGEILKVCNFSKETKAALRSALNFEGEIRPTTTGLSPLGSRAFVEIIQRGVGSGLITREGEGKDAVLKIRPYLQAALRFLLDNEVT